MAVLPFDNQTPEPTLTQEISRAVREAVEQRLGLRQSAETQADAVVRGSITRYEPDLPVAYQGDDSSRVTVTRRQVQITVSVEILDQKQGKPIWQRNGLVVKGDYQSGQEADGRRKALDDLVVNIVEGAQSQW
ncbi:MAG: LPS assembly lipoprotein LptE [Gemmatimonadales bacterium]